MTIFIFIGQARFQLLRWCFNKNPHFHTRIFFGWEGGVSGRRFWCRRHFLDLGQIWILAAVVPKIEEIKICVRINPIDEKVPWEWAWGRLWDWAEGGQGWDWAKWPPRGHSERSQSLLVSWAWFWTGTHPFPMLITSCRGKWKLLSCVWLIATPWTVACQAPLSMEFSRPEYWSG